MPIFAHTEFDDHEQVSFCNDPKSGLRAIIAVHNTNLGPALGGCRMWNYDSDAEALTDALRLSRGMTYKAALAGLPLGGGKSVIIGDPKTLKSDALFHAMGEFVNSFGGNYTVAEDVGITVGDVKTMAKITPHVAGTSNGGVGDPAPATAYGVFVGIKAAVRHKLGRDSLSGIRVAVQGLGAVGYYLCERLFAEGAELLVTDLNPKAVTRVVEEFAAEPVGLDEIFDQDVDVFAPCALGAVINDETLPRLRARVIAGSANNQLAEARHGIALAQQGKLYAPDFVINAGGLILVNEEHAGGKFDMAMTYSHIARIGDTLSEIFKLADSQGTPTSQAAERLARARFQKGAQSQAA